MIRVSPGILAREDDGDGLGGMTHDPLQGFPATPAVDIKVEKDEVEVLSGELLPRLHFRGDRRDRAGKVAGENPFDDVTVVRIVLEEKDLAHGEGGCNSYSPSRTPPDPGGVLLIIEQMRRFSRRTGGGGTGQF
jgi:hypothetical protein